MGKFAVIGDSILDKYSYYDSFRNSPEAPVPIITNEKSEYFLGGAGLVSDTLIDLGNEVDLYTMIGNELNSKIYKSLVNKIKIYDFAENHYNMTLKERIIVNKKYSLRKDFDAEKSPNENSVIETFLDLINKYDAVLFVDYNKGFLTKKLFDSLSKIASVNNLLQILDPNINNELDFKNVNFIKLNEIEAKYFSKKSKLKDIFKRLKKNNLNVIITLSSKGAVTEIDNKLIYVNPKKIKPVDVSGCGDVFLANFISNYIKTNNLKLSIENSVSESSKYVSFFGNQKK